MYYSSTRGDAEKKTSAEAILEGLAADGGLFVPSEIPQLGLPFVEAMLGLSYEERAEKVLSKFLTDYTEQELKDCVNRAYNRGNFDAAAKKRAEVKLPEDAPFPVLELWHGPTSAFKDMALQLLPQLMSTALRKNGVKDRVLILVATSGDTGKAALEGFRDVPQISILVFYPEGGVSRIQYLQMATQEGGNVNATAIRGNFDDAQSGVKEIFSDKAFNEKLAADGIRLSSANSINWGRLVPQIVYYFSAYADLVEKGRIKMGDAVNFSVPTGNFGDILAAYYAKCMGLPVHKLICASNANNVLTEFLTTGTYDRNRPFYKTITPSMDILISSNLERLLYHMTGDKARVKGWMDGLARTGRYSVDPETLAKIRDTFAASWTGDDQTKATIHDVFARSHYVLDTHSAVAWHAVEAYREETGDETMTVVVSTASPYKFNASVLEAVGAGTEGLDEFAMQDKLHEVSGLAIPRGLSSLRTKEIRQKDVVDSAEMREAVTAFMKKQD